MTGFVKVGGWMLMMAATAIAGWPASPGSEDARRFLPRFLGFGTHRVEAGTPLTVRLSQTLTSRTAYVGMAWTGTVARDVVAGEGVAIPAGSEVEGIVSRVLPEDGGRPTLGLAVRSVLVDGRRSWLAAESREVTAEVRDATGSRAWDAVLGSFSGSEGAEATSTAVIRSGTRVSFTVLRRVAVRS